MGEEGVTGGRGGNWGREEILGGWRGRGVTGGRG